MSSSDSHSSIAGIAWLAAVGAAAFLGGCALVLGIDEVSSASGPDSGQRVSASTVDPTPADASRADASALDDAGDDLR